MSALDKIKAKAAAAGKQVNMGVAQEGGGDYQPPKEGLARARFVGYFECGQHEVPDFNDKTKVKLKSLVRLVFELSGPNHPKNENGQPIRMTIEEPYEPGKGLGERANMFKIFTKMNYGGKATHIAELLGEAFLVTVYHKKSADGKKTFASLKGSLKTMPQGDGYNITGPTVPDPIGGGLIQVPVDPPVTPIKAFFFDDDDLEAWDAMFIEGEYPERKDDKGNVTHKARSKNVLQEFIRSAKNFHESGVAPLLAARDGGSSNPSIDVPSAEQPPRGDEAGEDDIPF